jgi:hypothetical protein
MEGRELELSAVDEGEREWLLDGLKALIQKRGSETFLRARILRALSEDFPDRVPEGAAGAGVLIRRLLWYAGMPDHRIRLRVYTEATFSELDHHGIGHAGPGTAAWFAGITAHICDFGVNARELSAREELIGTLGHEVAHAYRYHHGLIVPDAGVEEQLTDLTAVYLGFGVFLLNSSAVFKTGGYSASGERLLYEKRERGYLAPRQLALLLAAQVVARGLEGKARAAIAGELSPNHRKLFEDACELLPDPHELRKRLALPEPEAWPAASAEAILPLELDEQQELLESVEEDEPRPRASARRLESTQAGLLAMGGGFLPLALGALGFVQGAPLLAAAVLGAGLGYAIGVRRRSARCSACRSALPPQSEQCPACGAELTAVEELDEHDAPREGNGGDENEPATPDQSSALKLDADTLLICAMYAAWVIDEGHLSAEAEEQHAELVVAVRCGERPTARLADAWDDLAAGLSEPAASFVNEYFTRRRESATTDFHHLLESGGLRDTPGAYARVADLLESRLKRYQLDRQ